MILEERVLPILAVKRHGELSLDGPIRKDMPKLDVSICQNLADKQPPVTMAGVGLAAQQGDPMAAGPLDQALDRGRERLLL